MRAFSLLLAGAIAFLLCPRTASALSQGKHRDLSVSACSKHGLPSAFCDAVGAAAYNVDHHEWSDLAAHAQQEAGQSKCQAASAALERIRALSAELRAISAGSDGYDPKLAEALGRLLHTLQDNCAHAGMPNPQHAFLSLSDTCGDTELSPDVQPQALACAGAETALAFDAFGEVIVVPAPPFDPEQPGGASPFPQYWPKRADVCAFLTSAPSWDGVDRRWNAELVVPLFREQLHTSLVVDPTLPAADPCPSGQDALEPPAASPLTDTSQPPEWCTKLELYCAGKTDAVDEAPPWESDAAGASSERESAGCSASGPSPRGPALPLLFAALALATTLRAAARSRASRGTGPRGRRSG